MALVYFVNVGELLSLAMPCRLRGACTHTVGLLKVAGISFGFDQTPCFDIPGRATPPMCGARPGRPGPAG